MNHRTSACPPQKPSESQRCALIKLLADEDPEIYSTVRSALVSWGPEAGEWLRPHLLSSDPLLRRRARDIVRHFERQEADIRFLAFCLKHGHEFELETAAWLLAATEYPDINIQAYAALLDEYAGTIRERIDPADEGESIITAVNAYLFQELGFAGNQADYYDPENNYLNRVVDRRTGNPITLCLFYLLVARRLRLPVAGVGLPGHFICRYQSTTEEVYIDVFHGGRLLTKTDCVQYLARSSHGLREEFLVPVTSRRLVMRVCSNLHRIYLQSEQAEQATRIQRYIVALAR